MSPPMSELCRVERLRCHPANARVGNVDGIAESIRVNGFFGTIVAQRSTGYILAGNHRFRAAVQVGLAELRSNGLMSMMNKPGASCLPTIG